MHIYLKNQFDIDFFVFIQKYGLESHLNKCGVKDDKLKYLNKLYGRILYVLQINNDDKKFINYKEFVSNLKKFVIF